MHDNVCNYTRQLGFLAQNTPLAAFQENGSIDPGGGFVVDTLEIPGHTAHSTAFLLKNRNIAFTGDAIGSGSGVWLFNYDSF